MCPGLLRSCPAGSQRSSLEAGRLSWGPLEEQGRGQRWARSCDCPWAWSGVLPAPSPPGSHTGAWPSLDPAGRFHFWAFAQGPHTASPMLLHCSYTCRCFAKSSLTPSRIASSFHPGVWWPQPWFPDFQGLEWWGRWHSLLPPGGTGHRALPFPGPWMRIPAASLP